MLTKKSSSKQCKAIYLDRTIRLISVALLIFFKQDRTGSGKKKIQLMKVDCIVLS